MTDTRREWISKRAYTIWEEAGRPDGRDGDHWDQAERERADFEKGAVAKKAAKKPVIEISDKAKPVKAQAAKPKKKEAKAEKPAAAKVPAKAKTAKAAAGKSI
ncbi:DUF2934 domain-containing protein [Shinella oryzae]|uniref:DUF2934 domain-containing protein n=1 Tax=Shinella oryzae TaxID=2871820 RepID=A0ABY9KCU1_9HYPH|nr:DUF2934 domain-containing protein [Shinella oryzae]WLS06328.1 DUF2934 domain-containing protein [Shinella oryzae]